MPRLSCCWWDMQLLMMRLPCMQWYGPLLFIDIDPCCQFQTCGRCGLLRDTGYLVVHIASNLVSTQCPCRVLEIDPEFCYTCSMSSCQTVDNFFFSARYFFRKFWDIWVFRDPKFPWKTKTSKTPHSSTAWQGLKEHVCEQSGSLSKSVLDIKKIGLLCGKHV